MDVLTPSATGITCHTSNCGQQATCTCDRCQRPCCEKHARHITRQRRGESTTLRGHGGMLLRNPSHTEAFTLCLSCNKKPFVGVAMAE